MVTELLDPILAITWPEAWYTKDKSPVYHRADVLTGTLESPLTHATGLLYWLIWAVSPAIAELVVQFFSSSHENTEHLVAPERFVRIKKNKLHV